MSKGKRSSRGKRAIPKPCGQYLKRIYLSRHEATIAARFAGGRHGKKFYVYLCNRGTNSCGQYHLSTSPPRRRTDATPTPEDTSTRPIADAAGHIADAQGQQRPTPLDTGRPDPLEVS